MRQFSASFISPIARLASLSNRTIAILVFLVALAVYMQFPIFQSKGDAIWNLPTAFSLVNEGNTDLTEYELLINELSPVHSYTFYYFDGKPYNYFPLGASLVAAPFVAVFQQVSNLFYVDLYALSQQQFLFALDLFIASFVVAVAVALAYLIARFYLPNRYALFVTLIFGFGTSALSTASRGLWQHCPSILALAATLYCLLRAQRSAAWLLLAGFALAFAYIIRPTNSISVAVLTLYVALRFRQQSLHFFIGAALIALPFIYFNMTVYDRLLPIYYTDAFFLGTSVSALIEGLLGTLISPNRGLFIFSPILLLSIWGVGVKLRTRSLTGLDYCLLLIVMLHWVVISSFVNWHSGYSFGPRYMTDILPYLVFFLIPFFSVLPTLPKNVKYFAIGLLTLTTLVSLAIHIRGASVRATEAWNSEPVSVDEDRGRLWDWSDLQFMRGLGPTPSPPTPEPESSYQLEFDDETAPFMGDGWGDPELAPDGATYRWTIESQATLNLWLVADRDLEIEIGILRAMTPEILETFQFDVNGVPVELHANGQVYSGVIPVGALTTNGDPNEFRFTVTDPVSPRSLGENMDDRTLGLMVNYLNIRPIGDAPE